MDRMDFTHAVARIRVIEKRLLDKSKIERLLESDTVEDILKLLHESNYGENINNMKSIHHYEIILKNELKNLYKDMYSICPDRKIVDIMRLKYDYHNIKVLIKEKILDKDFESMLINCGVVSTDILKNSILTEDYRVLSNVMSEAITNTIENYNKNKDPQVIDITIDKYMFSNILQEALDTKVEFVINYVKQLIDITNIKTLFRVKKQNRDGKFLNEVLIQGGNISEDNFIYGLNQSIEEFISKIKTTPYAKVLSSILDKYSNSGDISSLDRLYDDYIMNHAKEAKKVNFGPEPIIAYIIAKETEIKIIRVIMVGKINKVPTELIRERVREVYV